MAKEMRAETHKTRQQGAALKLDWTGNKDGNGNETGRNEIGTGTNKTVLFTSCRQTSAAQLLCRIRKIRQKNTLLLK